MTEDILQKIPFDKWVDVQEAFKKDWPKNITIYSVVETQRNLINKGLGYGFKIYCPFGDVSNGMVAINDKIMVEDILQNIPFDKWVAVQEAFKKDWPKNITGYSVVETQRNLINKGIGYGFKIYCPFGDVSDGMVAINDKKGFYEIIIQTPNEDTSILEEALRTTKIIDWQRPVTIPFAPERIKQCIYEVVKDFTRNIEIKFELPSKAFFMDKDTSLFDVGFPPEITLDYLSLEHVDQINSAWPHKYATSYWYFDLLIRNKAGYGLFKDNQLVSWALINEVGTLCHMFTTKEHRRKKYAEMLLKHVCNVILKERKDIFIFCVESNVNASNLYTKIGCSHMDPVTWMYLRTKQES